MHIKSEQSNEYIVKDIPITSNSNFESFRQSVISKFSNNNEFTSRLNKQWTDNFILTEKQNNVNVDVIDEFEDSLLDNYYDSDEDDTVVDFVLKLPPPSPKQQKILQPKVLISKVSQTVSKSEKKEENILTPPHITSKTTQKIKGQLGILLKWKFDNNNPYMLNLFQKGLLGFECKENLVYGKHKFIFRATKKQLSFSLTPLTVNKKYQFQLCCIELFQPQIDKDNNIKRRSGYCQPVNADTIIGQQSVIGHDTTPGGEQTPGENEQKDKSSTQSPQPKYQSPQPSPSPQSKNTFNKKSSPQPEEKKMSHLSIEKPKYLQVERVLPTEIKLAWNPTQQQSSNQIEYLLKEKRHWAKYSFIFKTKQFTASLKNDKKQFKSGVEYEFSVVAKNLSNNAISAESNSVIVMTPTTS